MQKVLITVTNTNSIHRSNVSVLLKLYTDPRYRVVIDLPKANPYENNLNQIVQDFLEGDYDYWLQIDNDNCPTRNPLDLIALDKDIMLLPYLQWVYSPEDAKEGNYPICTLIMDDVDVGFREHKNMQGLQRVDAGGSGCMLIARRVLERMVPFSRTHDDHGRVEIGVDFNYCREARKKGFEVWCHYDYPVQHFKTLELMEVQTAFGNYYQKKYAKKTSTGKELVIFCGPTREKWDGNTFKERGIAGSEEAIIYLAPHLAHLGWKVTVYNNCVEEKLLYNVLWRPYSAYNRFDKVDVTILWRCPGFAAQGINSTVICTDLHDVGHPDQLRALPLDKIFVKSNYHKSLYNYIDDDKFAVIPNGINYSQFADNNEKRDPYLILNTSAPDRSLGTLIQLFLKVQKRVPKARMVWAYGWDLFDELYHDDAQMMSWKTTIIEAMDAHGIANLGRVTHEEIAFLCKKAKIWAYPTTFPEVCCISALKAQAGGAIPVTTNVGALDEYVEAIKIPVEEVGKRNYDYGLTKKEECRDWVNEVVEILSESTELKIQDFIKYDWANIASMWNSELEGLIKNG